MKNHFVTNLKHNWKSGLTVALVAIPLSISLAVAAGATPTQGIITAIWAGLIAGLFGGSNFNIVGPTGALSGILATFAFVYGPEKLAPLAIITGLIVLISWLLKLERYLILIPISAIQGFTLGVAFIIGFNQFNFALGLSGLTKHKDFIDNLIESLKNINHTSFTALSVFVIFISLLFFIDKNWKKIKALPIIPAAALLAPFGILLGYLSQNKIIPLSIQTLGSCYSDIAPKLFLPSAFSLTFDKSIIITAATVALIAIIETMLSAKIADNMTRTKHDKRKEMLGLGLANIASGLTGGIPATAALARTALNIKSGANHKTSAVMSSVFVAIISIFLLQYFKFLPLPVIAAILVSVAIRMIEVHHIKKMWQIDRKSFYIAMLVAAITIYEDPIMGILLGSIIALLMFVDNLSRGQFDVTVNDFDKKVVDQYSGNTFKKRDQEFHTVVYSIKGHLTYIDSQAHFERLESDSGNYENIILRLRELYLIDLDGLAIFDEIVTLIKKRGKEVYVSGANNSTIDLLRQSSVFKELEKSNHVFFHTTDALKHLGFNLNIDHQYE